MPWEMGGSELRDMVAANLRDLRERSTTSFRLVVDATYGRKDALLLEIGHVWGYSYPDWTPLLLRLSVFAVVENRLNGPSTPVQRLSVQNRPSDTFVHEFLYLRCGHVEGEGSPSWGKVGYTNAALLYPDAFEYLLGRSGFSHSRK